MMKASQDRQEGCWQGDHLFPLVPLSALVVVQSLSYVRLFVTPWTAAYQASLSFTLSWSLLKLMSIELVMPSNHRILCHSFLLLLSIFRSFPVSWLCTLGGRRIEISASASVLTMNIQAWFPLGLTGLISLQSRGVWRVFSSITIWNYQFFGTQPSLWSNSYICT